MKCSLPLVCVLAVLVAVCRPAEARQVRINRYATEVEADQALAAGEEVATVEEIRPRDGYPSSGYRPGRAFSLPDEVTEVADTTDEASTTAQEDAASTTVEPTIVSYLDDDSVTIVYEDAADQTEEDARVAKKIDDERRLAKAPYPAAGWRPSKAFLLPTEIEAEARSLAGTETPLAPFEEVTPTVANEESETTVSGPEDSPATPTPTTPAPPAPAATKRPRILPRRRPVLPRAPYPAAGWRPSKAFLLPTEVRDPSPSDSTDSRVAVDADAAEPKVKPTQKEDADADDVSKHPVCGVSLNPLAPKPAKGAKDDPDAERVLITAPATPLAAPAVVTVPAPAPARLLALRARPVFLAAQPIAFAGPW